MKCTLSWVYLHYSVVVRAQCALCYHRESLAHQHLCKRRLGVAYDCGQDVYGRLWSRERGRKKVRGHSFVSLRK